MSRILHVMVLLVGLCVAGCVQSTADVSDVVTDDSFVWPTFDEAVAAASKSGKPILIDIYTPWCGWCRKMQKEVYGNATLVAYVKEHFEYGRLNIDDSETQHDFMNYELTSQELGSALGARGTPTTVFLEQDGTYITRLDGYWALEPFGKAIRFIGSGAYQNQKYEEYLSSLPPGS